MRSVGRGLPGIGKTVIAVPTSAERNAFASGCSGHSAAADSALQIVQTGMGRERLEDILIPLLDGAAALVSLGTAGALSPQLEPGDLLLPRRVVCRSAGFAVEQPWHEGVTAALDPLEVPIHTGDLWCNDTVVNSVTMKRTLYEETAALAVDMESSILARLAEQRGLPFLVLRVVADGADQVVPGCATRAVDPAGNLDITGLLRELARHPAELAALIRMARGFGRAARTLRDAARFSAGVLAREPAAAERNAG